MGIDGKRKQKKESF